MINYSRLSEYSPFPTKNIFLDRQKKGHVPEEYFMTPVKNYPAVRETSRPSPYDLIMGQQLVTDEGIWTRHDGVGTTLLGSLLISRLDR